MTVKIIRKQAGVRQAMEAARKEGEIERIEVDTEDAYEKGFYISFDATNGQFFIKSSSCHSEEYLNLDKSNVRPLAQALLEIVDQLEKK